MAAKHQIDYCTKGKYETINDERTNDKVSNSYTIPEGCNIRNWKNNKYPLYIQNSVFDSDSLMNWILQWLIEFGYRNKPIYHLAIQLELSFKELNNSMQITKEIEQVSNDNIEVLIMLKDFNRGAVNINNKMQNILNRCTVPMTTIRKRYNYNSNEVIRLCIEQFISTMFNIDGELDSIQKLLPSINIWIQRFNVNCMPLYYK